MIGKLCFWNALFEEENKNVDVIVNRCSRNILKLEEEFQQAITEHADWHNLPVGVEQQLARNKKQQQFITEVINSLQNMRTIVKNLHKAYDEHVMKAEVGYEQEIEKLKQWRVGREADLLGQIHSLTLQLQMMDETYALASANGEYYFNLYLQLKHKL